MTRCALPPRRCTSLGAPASPLAHVSTALTIRMCFSCIHNTGVDQVLTMDLHHMQMQGFFDIPIDNLKASPILMNFIRDTVRQRRAKRIPCRSCAAWDACIACSTV